MVIWNNPSDGADILVQVDLGHSVVVWLLTGSEYLEVAAYYGDQATTLLTT